MPVTCYQWDSKTFPAAIFVEITNSNDFVVLLSDRLLAEYAYFTSARVVASNERAGSHS